MVHVSRMKWLGRSASETPETKEIVINLDLLFNSRSNELVLIWMCRASDTTSADLASHVYATVFFLRLFIFNFIIMRNKKNVPHHATLRVLSSNCTESAATVNDLLSIQLKRLPKSAPKRSMFSAKAIARKHIISLEKLLPVIDHP